jgi:hypothetical protein
MIGLVLFAAFGCKKHDANKTEASKTVAATETPKPAEPAAPAAATPTPSAAPAPAAKGAPHPPPPWLKGVEEKPTAAKVGQLAWVFHGDDFDSPDSSMIDVVQVTAIDGNTATTQPLLLLAGGADAWKHKLDPDQRPYAGLPGGLVIPARTVDEVKPKPSDLVFAYLGNTPAPLLVRVKAVENGLASFDQINAMKTGVDERKTDIVEPYGKGLAPFTYATYKDGDAQKLVTVLVVDGDTVIGYNASDALVQLKKSQLKPLKPELKSRKAGDKVYGFSGGEGKADAVKSIPVPDLAFEVGYHTLTWDNVFDKQP